MTDVRETFELPEGCAEDREVFGSAYVRLDRDGSVHRLNPPRVIYYVDEPVDLTQVAAANAYRAVAKLPNVGFMFVPPSMQGDGEETVVCEHCQRPTLIELATHSGDHWFCQTCVDEWRAEAATCAHAWEDDTDEFGEACFYCPNCSTRQYPDEKPSRWPWIRWLHDPRTNLEMGASICAWLLICVFIVAASVTVIRLARGGAL